MSFVLSDMCMFIPPPLLGAASGDSLTLWLSQAYALCIRNVLAETTPFQGRESMCSSPLCLCPGLVDWLLPLQPTNERT